MSGPGPASDPAADLYVAVGRLVRSLRQVAISHEGVGPGGFSAMVTLSRSPEGMRPSALAAVEGVSAPSLTRILHALEELALVRRTPDPSDGRAQLVRLTPGGLELIDSGQEARLSHLRERLASLPRSQRDAVPGLVEVLEALAAPLS